jgi:hypothetical protein
MKYGEKGFPPRPPIAFPKQDQSMEEALKRSLEAMDILLTIANDLNNPTEERIDACRAILGK